MCGYNVCVDPRLLWESFSITLPAYSLRQSQLTQGIPLFQPSKTGIIGGWAFSVYMGFCGSKLRAHTCITTSLATNLLPSTIIPEPLTTVTRQLNLNLHLGGG